MPRHRFTDTKERIERAAIALFVQKGVPETTVRDEIRTLCRTAKVFSRQDLIYWAISNGYGRREGRKPGRRHNPVRFAAGKSDLRGRKPRRIKS